MEWGSLATVWWVGDGQKEPLQEVQGPLGLSGGEWHPGLLMFFIRCVPVCSGGTPLWPCLGRSWLLLSGVILCVLGKPWLVSETSPGPCWPVPMMVCWYIRGHHLDL